MDELISAEAVVCTLILMGAMQAALSAAAMCRQRQYYLAIWLSCFSVEIASKGLLYLRVAPEWTQWFGYWFSFDIIYGPLLLLWVLRMSKPTSLSRWHLMHFIPAILYLYLTLPEAISMSEAVRAERIHNYLELGEWVSYSEDAMAMLSGLLWHPYAYVLIALGCLIWRRRHIPLHMYRWLFAMLLLHVAMWCAVIFGMGFVTWPLPLLFLASYLPAVAWINFLAWISLSFLQLNRPEISKVQNPALAQPKVKAQTVTHYLQQETTPAETKEKYQHTRLDKDQQQQIADQLEALIAQKVYTQSRLSLADVANLIGIAPHYISQVINDHYQCSFTDFINRHRLDAVKHQLGLINLQQHTILEIALENGFNSKSTFNTAFKKDTGVTPSQYRKQKLKENCEADLKSP